MDKLQRLLDRCVGQVCVDVNFHRSVYETVEDHLACHYNLTDEIPDEVRKEMIARNTVVCISCYPDNHIGFYTLWHYDLNTCLDLALKAVGLKTN